MTVTIREVAREAAVSVATVSRVVNKSTPVNADTRHRVEQAVRALHYVPHGGARSLITRRTSTFGVLLPDLYGEFFSEVIRGLDETARSHGYHLLVSRSHSDQKEIEAAMRAMRGRVDGLVVMCPDLDAHTLAANLPETLPIVLLNCGLNGQAFDSVSVDNSGGAHAIVRHLLSHGHERVATITGPARNTDALDRVRGYRSALREAGIEPDPSWELSGNFTEDAGYDAARRMLELAPRPTAVFASNDSMAIGAISAFREAGLRIPNDVAVTGFDDIPIAHYLTPPLSSVHVPISELGAKAITKLVFALQEKNRHVRSQDVVPTTLVIRNTCGTHEHPQRREAPRSSRRLFCSHPSFEAVA